MTASPTSSPPASPETETEVGDEESLYDVEVTPDDSSPVDVQRSERFGAVGTCQHGLEAVSRVAGVVAGLGRQV